MRRADPRTTSLDARLPDPKPEPHPAARLENEELREVLERALDRLRPTYRAAIVLRYHEALSYANLARVMGIPGGHGKDLCSPCPP